MLPGITPIVGQAPLPPAVLSWINGYSAGSINAASFTRTGVSLGVAAADRLIIIGVAIRGDGGAARTINSATLGGVAMTRVVTTATSFVCATAIFALLVPAGTSATFVCTSSGAVDSYAIGVASLTGYSSATASSSMPSAGATTTNTSITLDVLKGGAAVYVASVGSAATFTWGGATMQMNLTTGSIFRGSAATFIPDANQAGYVSTVTVSASGTLSACGAAWR